MKRVRTCVLVIHWKPPGPGAAGNTQRPPTVVLFDDYAAMCAGIKKLQEEGKFEGSRRYDEYYGDPMFGHSDPNDFTFAPNAVYEC